MWSWNLAWQFFNALVTHNNYKLIINNGKIFGIHLHQPTNQETDWKRDDSSIVKQMACLAVKVKPPHQWTQHCGHFPRSCGGCFCLLNLGLGCENGGRKKNLEGLQSSCLFSALGPRRCRSRISIHLNPLIDVPIKDGDFRMSCLIAVITKCWA